MTKQNPKLYCTISGVPYGELTYPVPDIDNDLLVLYTKKHPQLLHTKGDYKQLPRWWQYCILIRTYLIENHNRHKATIKEIAASQRVINGIGEYICNIGDMVFENAMHETLFLTLYNLSQEHATNALQVYMPKITNATELLEAPDKVLIKVEKQLNALLKSKRAFMTPTGWTAKQNSNIAENKPTKNRDYSPLAREINIERIIKRNKKNAMRARIKAVMHANTGKAYKLLNTTKGES